MNYGRTNRRCVVVELLDDDDEIIDLTGEQDEIFSINHEAPNMRHMDISRSDAKSRTSYERTNRGCVVIELLDDDDMVIDLTGESDEVIGVSDSATTTSDADTNNSNEGSVTSSEDTNMNDEDIGSSSVNDEAITTSVANTNTSDEGSVTSSEDTDMSDEDIETMSVSDEAGTDTDATSQESNDDDYQPDEVYTQPDEEPVPRRHSTSVDMTVDSWLDEWPDQSPSKEDLEDIQRWHDTSEECLIPIRRHSQKFRDAEYRKASIFEILVVFTQVQASERYLWLPSAFDYPRGRPYEIICERVWDSWRRSRRDSLMRDAVPSIEKGAERNWPNAGPAMLRFPQHRIRHPKRRRD